MFSKCTWLQSQFSYLLVFVQLLSCIQLFVIPWTAGQQPSLSFTVSQSFLNFISIELVILSNHLTICHLLLLCLPSFPASGSFRISWFFGLGGQSISPSNEYTGLISFRIDWFDFLAVQGALKSLQHAVRKHQSFGAQPSLWPKSNTERIRLLKTNEEGDSDVWWRDLPLVEEENGLHGNGRNCSKGVKASRCLQQESEGFWI